MSIIVVSSGQVSSGVTLNASVFMNIYSSGKAEYTKIMDGGSMLVYDGGRAKDTKIYSGGRAVVSSGGLADYTSVHNIGYLIISSGGIGNENRVFDGGFYYVSSGGSAVVTMVNSGGDFFVDNGGWASNTVIDQSGYMGVSKGGFVSETQIQPGGHMLLTGSASKTYVFGSLSLVGTATSTMVNPGGSMHVTFSGTANNTIVSGIVPGVSGLARMAVYGVANSTTIGESGYVEVGNGTNQPSAGGHVYDTVVNSGGWVDVTSDSFASRTTVNGGVFNVTRGGKVTSTTVNSGGEFYIFSDGVAYETQVNDGGKMTVFNGGVAYSGTIVNSGGSIILSSGGVTTDTTINGGSIILSSGGVTTDTTINDSGSMLVLSSASANSATLTGSGTYLYVMSKGVANDLAINDKAQAFVKAGGSVNKAALDHGYAIVSGVIDSATVANSGWIVLMSDGRASNTTINSLGEFTVSEGGIANNVTVSSGGFMCVKYGGAAKNASIRSGGSLAVSRGGFLTSVTVNSGGTATVLGTIYINDFVVNGKLQVWSGGTMSNGQNLTMGSSATLRINGGGTVDGAVVKTGAQVTVESGGSFGTAGISGASVTAKTGAYLDGVFLNSGSILEAGSGAHLADVCVSSGAVLTGVLQSAGITFSGGTLDLNIAKASENDGFLVDGASYNAFKSDTYDVTISIANKQMNGTYNLITGANGFNKTITVKFLGNNLGTLTVNGGPTDVGNITCDLKLTGRDLTVTVTGGAIPDPIVSSATLIDERKDITSGMSAIDVTVSSGGILNVFSSGVASNTTVWSGGEFNLNSRSILRGATIHSGGTATIYEDTRAQNVIVDGGTLNVESDAFIVNGSNTSNVIVSNGGTLNLNGGWVDGALVSGGKVEITSDGSMFSATVANGTAETNGSGFVGAAILEGGVVTLASGGTGSCTVSSGGTIRLAEGCELNGLKVYEGGVVTGVMHGIYSVVTFYKGTLDLDISGIAPSNEYLIDMDANLDFSHGMSCTLTVNGSQANGTYNLMESAYEFDTQVITAETPLTVKSADGTALGTLTVGQTATIGGANYTLNLSDDYHLTVTIEGGAPTPPPIPGGKASSDIDGNGISDVMFIWTGNDYAHGYWMNGTNEWRSTGSNHPAEWENLGCYDMTGDGKADSVLVGNVVVEGVKGAYIGYYADAIDEIDGSTWVNIDYLNNEANITWVNKIGNLTGGNANSIVWYAPELYTLGAWTDGTSSWTTITGNFGGDDWKLVGCGDFDGDGKDSVVMSGANGANFYAADLDGTVTSLGSANWSGWTVRAIGDFAGDGKDDLVLFHQETGSMVMLADGSLDDFTSIGQLDANDWFVVGAGNYNADAKDDLLVRQKSTGMLGYYSGGDVANGWVELGRGVDTNWTVIA